MDLQLFYRWQLMKPVWASPGIYALNQNQRYEVLMHFTGYECLMALPGHRPGYKAYKGFTGV